MEWTDGTPEDLFQPSLSALLRRSYGEGYEMTRGVSAALLIRPPHFPLPNTAAHGLLSGPPTCLAPDGVRKAARGAPEGLLPENA